MTIGRLCHRTVRTAAPAETVRAAAERMREEHVGCLVVTEDEHPVGVVTDRDVALHILCDDLDPEKAYVRDVMEGGVVSIGREASVEDAIDALRRATVRRLVVVDDAGKPTGVFAADDLLRMLASEIDDLAEALRVQFTTEARATASRVGQEGATDA